MILKIFCSLIISINAYAYDFGGFAGVDGFSYDGPGISGADTPEGGTFDGFHTGITVGNSSFGFEAAPEPVASTPSTREAISKAHREMFEDLNEPVFGFALDVYEGFLDLVGLQSTGQYDVGELLLESLEVHPNSEAILANIKAEYRSSGLGCYISNMGLKYATMVVVTNLTSSAYIPYTNTIILSYTELNRKGIALLDHELLHAGVFNGLLRGKLTKSEFNWLNNLNQTHFSSYNGYVGSSNGALGNKGFGEGEAFAVGWGYAKLKRRFNNFNSTQKTKVTRYLRDVERNRATGATRNGQPIHWIHTGASANKISNFLDPFYVHGRAIRTRINQIQTNVNSRTAQPLIQGYDQ